MRREQELLQKTETLLDSPTSQTKSDLYILAPNTRAKAIELFKKVDIDNTGALEVEVLVPSMSIKELKSEAIGERVRMISLKCRAEHIVPGWSS